MPTVDPRRRFGTFTGVFVPTLLTILGVIMYVRVGWVVGNAGLIGAWLIMALALGITAATGLSLSSIATNTRIGDGGAYAIMNRSLGFEVGASIGIPLYLTRPLGTAMYIFGFREGWLWLFPTHNAMLVDVGVFVLLWGTAWISAEFAFRVQYVIMGLIGASLVSILASEGAILGIDEAQWFGTYPGFPEDGFQGTDFWAVFAVFFPATTGILAGANMSGELRDPRRAIAVGTLSAIVVSTVIYFALTLWAVQVATPEELVSDYNLFLDKARWGWAVLAGLLGATASSALAGLVGGPRIVMAMGQHKLLPFSDWVGFVGDDGEPRNAMLLTGGLTAVCLLMRDLNAIAPLLTMFFLITYGALNFVVLLEQSLGVVSFRPTLKIPRWVPLFGLLGTLLAMFIVSPTFGFISLMVVFALYVFFERRGVGQSTGVSSSIFQSVAEWAAQRVLERDNGESVRAWKPSFLVPVEDPDELRGEYSFLVDVARPEGSVKLLALTRGRSLAQLEARVAPLGRSFRDDGVNCTWSAVEEEEFGDGVIAALQALQSAFFRPNMLFLTLPDLEDRHEEFARLIEQARATRVGVTLLGLHPRAGLGRRRSINLWLRWQGLDWDVDQAFSVGSLNLTLLMGYRLQQQWGADLRVITVVPEDDEVGAAREYLEEVVDLARLSVVGMEVLVGGFEDCVGAAEEADLAVMGLQRRPDFAFVSRMVETSRSSCLMVLDSGRESARS
ncbi:MAG: hypothetical protein KDA24_03735 [Deltaproteobacteria bacterium]|nr:hypothetical protein [Deltaproteobacteria bacterium]